ncbi:MAG: RluA family pseudouridine synthase [Synergistaceae bacterium]|jgi:23S rRNA pseudouridine1911/1915/1917 synthase|nr:RluA family pseudouridine synthase [Synergistaceae bacterium]
MRGSSEDPVIPSLEDFSDGGEDVFSSVPDNHIDNNNDSERVERFECDEGGTRLDVFLSRRLGVTRAFAQRLIKEDRVGSRFSDRDALPPQNSVSAKKTPKKLKPSYKTSGGEIFVVKIPPTETLEIEPEEVPFEVVHEDSYLLVVNKPAGLVVHPAPGHWRGTLVHGLLFRYPDLGPFNNVRRPGIVHRLDATTSGLMLVAREQKTMELLQRDFRERSIEKKYLALVHGNFSRPWGLLEGPIGRHPQNRLKMAVVEGGRPSTTEYRVLWNDHTDAGYALVLCGLLTGRTHQIRVHMAAAGHPLVGDILYGLYGLYGPYGAEENSNMGVSNFDRVFLHSWRLAFTHPITKEMLRFTCPLPPELREHLCRLRASRTPSRNSD